MPFKDHQIYTLNNPLYPIYLGTTPHPVTVTTRIIPFLVGNPYKPSFVVTGRWVDQIYTLSIMKVSPILGSRSPSIWANHNVLRGHRKKVVLEVIPTPRNPVKSSGLGWFKRSFAQKTLSLSSRLPVFLCSPCLITRRSDFQPWKSAFEATFGLECLDGELLGREPVYKSSIFEFLPSGPGLNPDRSYNCEITQVTHL